MEAIIVCVDYADFLSETLPWNKKFVDRFTIVTTERDEETIKVANDNGVDLVLTNAMHEDGAVMNRGRALNDGLSMVRHNGWCAIMDADIALLEKHDAGALDRNALYGVQRANVESRAAWEGFKEGKGCQYSVLPSYGADDSYLPLGYFQMFHFKKLKGRKYPEGNKDAAQSDLDFALQWDKRECLPGLALHLTTDTTWGVNWQGRKSPRF